MGFFSSGVVVSASGGETAVPFSPRGSYDNTASYEVNDLVSYNGSAYICTSGCNNVEPTDESCWAVLIENTYASETSDGIITSENFMKLESLEDASKTSVEVVESLPTTDISTTTIYLIKRDDGQANSAYDEYIYVDGTWEKVGDEEVDLSNYITKDEIDVVDAEDVEELWNQSQ